MALFTTSPKSPTSPRRKRQSLRIPSIQSNNEPLSPAFSQNGFEGWPSHSRKSSQSSFHHYSPVTPRPTSSRSKRPSSSRLSIGSNISAGLVSNAGLGNLADELEDVWDDDFEGNEGGFLQDEDQERLQESPTQTIDLRQERVIPQSPRSPVESNNLLRPPDKPSSPSKQWASMGTHHKTESLYDVSDYGPSSDDEAFDAIAPTLQRRIHDVEEIARISANTESVSESGGVIARTTSALKENLGLQTSIESGVTRLITAYTSMGTHRSHQSREVLSAFHAMTTSTSFLSTLFDLPPETLDSLISELDSLISTLPFLPTNTSPAGPADPLEALHGFATNSYELISLLHDLSDTLTEHRQHLLTATRRLKSVRDLVDDVRIDEDLIETSMLLIQAGDWDRRCRERHAAKAVGEVLEGFRKNWDIDYAEGVWRPSVTSRREVQVQ